MAWLEPIIDERGQGVAVAANYNYMPVTRKDIASSVASSIEANAGLYTTTKIAGTILGGIFGGGAFGAVVGSAIPDLIAVWHNSTKSNDEFWSDALQNYKELQNEGKMQQFFSGAARGMSYVAGADIGFKDIGYNKEGVNYVPAFGEPLYESLPRSTVYDVGNVIGTIANFATGFTTASAAKYSFPKFFIGSEATRGLGTEVMEEMGIGSDASTIIKNGVASGAISAFSAWSGFSLMPKVMSALPWKYLTGNVGTWMESTIKPVVNSSLEFGIFASADQSLRSMLLDEEPLTFENTVSYFGLGALLGGAGAAVKVLSDKRSIARTTKLLEEQGIISKEIKDGTEYLADKAYKEADKIAAENGISTDRAIIINMNNTDSKENYAQLFNKVQNRAKYRATKVYIDQNKVTMDGNIIQEGSEYAFNMFKNIKNIQKKFNISREDAIFETLSNNNMYNKQNYNLMKRMKWADEPIPEAPIYEPDINIQEQVFSDHDLKVIRNRVEYTKAGKTEVDKINIAMSKLGYPKQMIQEYITKYVQPVESEGITGLIKLNRVKSNANKLIQEANNARSDSNPF